MGNLADPTIRILSKIPDVDQQMVKTYAVLLDNIEAMAVAGAGIAQSPTTPVIGAPPSNPRYFKLAGETNNAPLWQEAGLYWYSDNGTTRTGYIDMTTATVMELVNPKDSALAIHLKSYENDNTGIVSTIHHYGRDDGDAEQEYARQHVVVNAAGAAAEQGEFQWQLIEDGSFPSNLNQMRLTGGRSIATDFYLQSEMGSDTNEFATIQFWARDSQPASEQYASITAKIIDNTTTTEDGALLFQVVSDGTVTTVVDIQPGQMIVDAPAGSAGTLFLTTSELTVVDGDVLGRINFQAPLESSGSDAILVGASIWAEADAEFTAAVNKTDLVFATAETATATEKMRLTWEGYLGIGTTIPGLPLEVQAATSTSRFIRNTAETAIVHTVAEVAHYTTQTASDGFGVRMGFRIDDNAGGGRTIGYLACQRDGGRNYGAFVIQTVNNGSIQDSMYLTSDRRVGIGHATPDGFLHVDQFSSTGAVPVLLLDQGDVSEQCIQFSSDATDQDINLFTVNVTGAPTLLWDESEDAFDLNKGLKLTGTLDTGGFIGNTVSKSSGYTATATDYTIRCDASGGGFTITLPAVASHTGRVLHIKKSDSSGNVVVVDGASSEEIDGATTASLTVQFEVITIQSNGSSWDIL